MKREKEALIWASAANNASGDRKSKNNRLDKQSRNILGKGFHNYESSTKNLTSPPKKMTSPNNSGNVGSLGGKKKTFKVLTGNETIQLPKRNNQNLQKVSQIHRIRNSRCLP